MSIRCCDAGIWICRRYNGPVTDAELYHLAERIGRALKPRNLVLATAESCTGGWISEAITSVAGSSDWFDRGFVTYSNRAKEEMLGVRAETLAEYGAVSEQTVAEMALGAVAKSGADVAIAVSGIAGPGGAVPGKPVGTVSFAWVVPGRAPVTETRLFSGDRADVRRRAVVFALEELLHLV